MSAVPLGGIDRAIGAALRTRRRHMGLSQGELGEALGVTFQQVGKYEAGTNRIALSRMPALCRALAWTADDLLAAAEAAGRAEAA